MTLSLFSTPLPDLSTPGAYAGVGARATPGDVLDLMVRIGEALAKRGVLLRSGAAQGADTAFEVGTLSAGGRHEIYLPWSNFDQRRIEWADRERLHVWVELLERARSRLPAGRSVQVGPSFRAEGIAARTHPRWIKLSKWDKRLHARNSHEILGPQCDDPVRFVICWTPDGATEKTTSRTGGTGQAIRLAVANQIPIWNLQRHDHREAWEKWLREA